MSQIARSTDLKIGHIPKMGDVGDMIRLPCERVLSRATVAAYVSRVPGCGPVVVEVHPGTRGYGDRCFTCPRVDVLTFLAGRGTRRVLSVVCAQQVRSVTVRVLRMLLAAIWMYEPGLVRLIQRMVPPEPLSVTTVGKSTFNHCARLKDVWIPDSATSIEEGAFYSCSSLTSIDIPDSVTSIGAQAFESCVGLTSMVIPDSVEHIGNLAFRGCRRLTVLSIGTSVSSLNLGAFGGCTALVSVVIPGSVTHIGDSAFQGCSAVTSVKIPNSVSSIGDHAFAQCAALVSVAIPDSVSSIGISAFEDCAALEFVELSPTVDVDATAFNGCSPRLVIIRRE